MLNIWEADIKAMIPSHIIPANDISVRDFIFNGKFGEGRLAKLYYFIHHEIKDSIYAIQKPNGWIDVHPGWNRYIGASLREKETWIPAKIFTNDNESPIINPCVRWKTKVGKIKIKKNAIIHAVNTYADNERKNLLSLEEYYDFLIKRSKNARIEIHLDSRKIIFNPEGQHTIFGDVRCHNGVWPTLKYIFNRVDEEQKGE